MAQALAVNGSSVTHAFGRAESFDILCDGADHDFGTLALVDSGLAAMFEGQGEAIVRMRVCDLLGCTIAVASPTLNLFGLGFTPSSTSPREHRAEGPRTWLEAGSEAFCFALGEGQAAEALGVADAGQAAAVLGPLAEDVAEELARPRPAGCGGRGRRRSWSRCDGPTSTHTLGSRVADMKHALHLVGGPGVGEVVGVAGRRRHRVERRPSPVTRWSAWL